MAVLRLIASGMTNDQIARALGKRPSTVKIQAGSIFKKLGVHSRVSAAMWYWRHEAG
jgi:DNA-binding NarL/FixJ family response regulator